MEIFVPLLLIVTGVMLGWSGWTVLRAPFRANSEASESPYRSTPLNRALLQVTAWLGAIVGPGIAIIGGFLLGMEMVG